MLGFTIWLGLLSAAGLCFPRRPHVTGMLFILLGVWSVVLRLAALGGARPVPWGVALGTGVIWFALGIRLLSKYSDHDARAAHVRH